MQNKAMKRNATSSWRLDWEEDGRWVEWRIDEEEQSEHDRFRWEEGSFRKSSFNRGSTKWWREQYYEYEYAGSGGVQSMSVVREACETLGVSDAGDAGAIRKSYLSLVNKWHPDRFQEPSEKAKASERFREVQEAYEVLKEKQNR
ncbi:hypothetical protein GUITHDRAFT_108360 [Guillardia theta CCMP2712]|uniref:J domain-containing protein n=1 Tax=Guillardia theta (strain CCMP2712) TaxID=905079 RepID=L1JCR0_GUITC|nr:hypothetical protein GUITHDRAFT_108360 [Guillardia theta CCMP2712]EKX45909.1 hypothetical protein GUITHDRAFT_108360 [Guillardia theta CCMP2712]|eukprot:XP_005832889.1 hypothetical protein GUITHDRAFT_108360 [Guillardia theta CCMP2712]